MSKHDGPQPLASSLLLMAVCWRSVPNGWKFRTGYYIYIYTYVVIPCLLLCCWVLFLMFTWFWLILSISLWWLPGLPSVYSFEIDSKPFPNHQQNHPWFRPHFSRIFGSSPFTKCTLDPCWKGCNRFGYTSPCSTVCRWRGGAWSEDIERLAEVAKRLDTFKHL